MAEDPKQSLTWVKMDFRSDGSTRLDIPQGDDGGFKGSAIPPTPYVRQPVFSTCFFNLFFRPVFSTCFSATFAFDRCGLFLGRIDQMIKKKLGIWSMWPFSWLHRSNDKKMGKSTKNRWTSTKIHEIWRKSTKIWWKSCENLRKSVNIWENIWKSAKNCETTGKSVKIRWGRQKSAKIVDSD